MVDLVAMAAGESIDQSAVDLVARVVAGVEHWDHSNSSIIPRLS
jgi:hypothetical protein